MFRSLFGPFNSGTMFADIEKTIDSCFREIAKPFRGSSFPTEISFADKNTVITIALAGISKERVKVKVKDGESLTVAVLEETGESKNRFSSKSSEMTFALLSPVSKVEPVMKDGLLTITLYPLESNEDSREEEIPIS